MITAYQSFPRWNRIFGSMPSVTTLASGPKFEKSSMNSGMVYRAEGAGINETGNTKLIRRKAAETRHVR